MWTTAEEYSLNKSESLLIFLHIAKGMHLSSQTAK